MKSIDVYEHGRLLVGEEGFQKKHWDAFVKLNTLHQVAYFDVLHNGLKFKQYVGVIQVDGLSVNIHPKADKSDGDEKWKNVLLQMLKACGRIKADTADSAQLKKQQINLLEVYFQFFLNEVEGLVHRGLVKKYRKETGNVKALKGKLEFAGNIRHNLIHKERFYTSHQVYDLDHQLHQVLAHALDIVGQFSKGTHLSDQLRRVVISFPPVKQITPNAQTLSALKIDRKTAPYERAFELAKFIILNYSPDINYGKQKMISLLFDMNELWEEYVFVMLRKEVNSPNSPYGDYAVYPQASKRFWNNNSLQPDILLEHKPTGRKFIIDTKWKRPGYSASIEDLRQVYAYARFWDAQHVMLLYPGDLEQNQQHYFKTKDVVEHQNELISHNGFLRFVQVVGEGRLNQAIGKEILMGFVENLEELELYS